MVLVTPRLWADPHMGSPLKSRAWWSLWVLCNSGYSVIYGALKKWHKFPTQELAQPGYLAASFPLKGIQERTRVWMNLGCKGWRHFQGRKYSIRITLLIKSRSTKASSTHSLKPLGTKLVECDFNKLQLFQSLGKLAHWFWNWTFPLRSILAACSERWSCQHSTGILPFTFAIFLWQCKCIMFKALHNIQIWVVFQGVFQYFN